MGWTKDDEAVKSNHKVLLESYGKLRKLLDQGPKDPGLAPFYIRTLISYVKMGDSLRRNALQSEPIKIEEVLEILPPVLITLRKVQI